jgi:ankyrin repeat protein
MVNSSIDAVRLLVSAGADPNDGADCVLANHDASLEATRFLLETGTDVNRIGYEQCTLVMYETYMNNHENVQLLIDHDADVNYRRSSDGYTSLHYAAKKSGKRMIKLLLTGGADVLARTSDGQSPADLAREHGRPEYAALLK